MEASWEFHFLRHLCENCELWCWKTQIEAYGAQKFVQKLRMSVTQPRMTPSEIIFHVEGCAKHFFGFARRVGRESWFRYFNRDLSDEGLLFIMGHVICWHTSWGQRSVNLSRTKKKTWSAEQKIYVDVQIMQIFATHEPQKKEKNWFVERRSRKLFELLYKKLFTYETNNRTRYFCKIEIDEIFFFY